MTDRDCDIKRDSVTYDAEVEDVIPSASSRKGTVSSSGTTLTRAAVLSNPAKNIPPTSATRNITTHYYLYTLYLSSFSLTDTTTSTLLAQPVRLHRLVRSPIPNLRPSASFFTHKMSWQAYVDTSLVGSGHVDKAAIFDDQGRGVWAATPGFSVSPEEVQAVVGSFKPVPEGQLKDVQTNGFTVGGEKYIALQSDDSRLYGKKGKEGVVIVKTKKALLIAHYPEDIQPGQATNTVERLGDYLSGVGY